jgi:hypothetical protein
MNRITRLAAIVFASILFSGSLMAQTAEDYHPFLSDRFNLSLGGFWAKKDLKLRIDGSSPGDEIDFEETLGLDDDETTGALNFRWRFGQKWSVWGQYWKVSDSGGEVLTEDIKWEDVVFKEGTFARAGLDTKIARVFFGRTFSNSPQHEFGAGAGLHHLEISAFVDGQIITEDDSLEFYTDSISADFPLPNIGAWYAYSWSPKWVFQARLDWLSASIGDYSGSLWNAQAGIHWQTFKHFGVGLYYNAFLLDVDVDKEEWSGRLESTQNGPYLALTASW